MDENKAKAIDALRLARDIGAHAESEAFTAIMRILETAPNVETKILAMTVVATRLAATTDALFAVIDEFSPKLAAVTRSVIAEFRRDG